MRLLPWLPCVLSALFYFVAAQSPTPTPSPSPQSGQCSVSLVAGQDGVSATVDAAGASAGFQLPWGLVSSPDGSALFTADAIGGRVRRLDVTVDPATVTTVSGMLSAGGADGPLGTSQHTWPAGFAWSSDGAWLFVTDSAGPTVRVLTSFSSTPTVATIAGSYSVTGAADGVGTAASFTTPFAIALHPISGVLYVSDAGSSKIRALVPSSPSPNLGAAVTTAAGNAGPGYADGRATTVARFQSPVGLAITPVTGTFLYIVDGGNHRVRVLDISTGMVSTLAGSGAAGFADGWGASATFWSPSHVVWDNSINPGGLLLADTGTNRIRSVSLLGAVSTIAGSGEFSGNNGAASRAGFRGPRGLASSPTGTVYVADSSSNTIRAIRCPSLSVTPTPSVSPSVGASLSSSPTPSSSATATGSGTVTPTGTPSATPTPSAPCQMSTFAGTAGLPGFTDATGAAARFQTLTGLAVDSISGTVFVADSGNVRVRAVSAAGVVTTLAGNGVIGTVDGLGTNALLGSPLGGLALSPNGTLFVADLGNQRIRRIETPNAIVTTLSGGTSTTVTAGYVDGGAATARFNAPEGLALDPVGWILYVSESVGHRVRAIRADNGATTTLAGSPLAPSGIAGWFDTTFGKGSSDVLFNGPRGIAWTGVGGSASSGSLLSVMDTLNNRVRLTAAADGATGTLAGMSPPGTIVDGVGAAALLGAPAHATALSSAMNMSGAPFFSAGPFVLFTDTNRLRAVDVVTARVFTVAGTGVAGSANGAPLSSTFSSPLGVGVDTVRGRIFVADSSNFALRLYSCPAYTTATPSASPTASFGTSLSATPSLTASATTSAAGCFVSVLAGSGVSGNTSAVGRSAQFNAPIDVAVLGNTLYVVSEAGQTVQAVDLTTKLVTTFHGQYLLSGTVYSPGYASLLSNPRGVHADPTTNGTLFVAVAYSYNIRAVNATTGNSVAYACSGSPMLSDNVAPLSGGCFWPDDTATDSYGNLFIADANLHRIRKVTRPPGALITTLAGGGAAAYIEAVGTNAAFSNPMGVAAHPSSGWVYVSDTGNHRIRAIFSPTGATTLLAGSGTATLSDGIGASASFNSPRHIALHPLGLALVVGDRSNNAIRWVELSTRLVTTLVGSSTAGNVLGLASLAKLNYPSGMVFSPTTGIGYIADTNNHQIKAYTCSASSATQTPSATLSVLASPSVTPSATRTQTQTATPSVSPSATPLSCTVSNAAGMPNWGGGSDGSCNPGGGPCIFGSSTALYVAADPSNSYLAYVTDGSSGGIVRRIGGPWGPSGGFLSSFVGGPAGSSPAAGYVDAVGTLSRFGAGITGLVFTPNWPSIGSNLYILDSGNMYVRNVSSTGLTTTLSGAGLPSGYRDGAPADARFGFVGGSQSALNQEFWPNLLIVTDTGNHRIRTVDTVTGWAGTLAGSGAAAWVDGTCATAAFSGPKGIAVNSRTGDIYVSDTGNHRIRTISMGTCLVTTLAGSVGGFLDSVGVGAKFLSPINIAWDSNVTGGLLVADSGNHRIRMVDPVTQNVGTFAGSGLTSSALGSANVAMFPGVKGVAVSPSGIVSTADNNNVVRQIVCAPGVFASPSRTPSASTFSSPSVSPSPSASPSPSRGAGGASGAFACAVTRLSGVGISGAAGSTDGVGGLFNLPTGLALSAASDILYVCDSGNHVIRAVSVGTSVASTIAGLALSSGAINGQGTNARFSSPYALSLLPAPTAAGTLFVSDTGSNLLRSIDVATGMVTTVCGTGATGYADNAVGTSAIIQAPRGSALFRNASGGVLLFVLDGTHRLRTVRAAAPFSVSTLAGSGVAGFSDGLGTLAVFSAPRGLAAEPDPSNPALYVSDSGNAAVRRVSLASDDTYGFVTTLSGTPLSAGFANGPAGTARFNSPGALFVSPWNFSLLVSDTNNHLIRAVVTADGRVDSFAGTLGAGNGGGNGWAIGTALTLPDGGVAAPAANGGAMYLSNTAIHTLLVVSCAISQSPSFTPTPSRTSGVTPTSTATFTPSATPSATTSRSATTSSSQTPSATPTAVACLSRRYVGTGVAGWAASTGGATGQLSLPAGLASDFGGTGLLYIADRGNHRLRFAFPQNGTCPSSWVGGGVAMWANGLGTAASLLAPSGLALVSSSGGNGTLWVGETGSHRVRIVYPDGRVATVAGSGAPGSVDGIGTGARFNQPEGVAVVPPLIFPENGGAPVPSALLVADSLSHAIRFLTNLASENNATVTTLAGCGQPALVDAPVGSSACLFGPRGVSASATTAYVADTGNHAIRSVSLTTGATVTVAGGAGPGYADAATGAAALFSSPIGIVLDPLLGVLYVADTGTHRVRVVNPAVGGMTSTLAGTGIAGLFDGALSVTTFTSPFSLALGGPGGMLTGGSDLFVSDSHTVRRLSCALPSPSLTPSPTLSLGATSSTTSTASISATPSSTPSATPTTSGVGCVVSMVAGGAPGAPGAFADGARGAAAFNTPSGISEWANVLYIGDTANHRLRALAVDGAVVTTVAGSGVSTPLTDGACLGYATFFSLTAVIVDQQRGTIWVADSGNHAIRSVAGGVVGSSVACVVTTLAGNGVAGAVDGIGAAARFNTPSGLALSSDGSLLYVADTASNKIRTIAVASGTALTISGTGVASSVDGVNSVVTFNAPRSLVVEAGGNALLIADTGGSRLRRAVLGGGGAVIVSVSTAAGATAGNQAGFGVAPTTRLNQPWGLAVDSAAGGVVFTETVNNDAKRFTAAGWVMPLAGLPSGVAGGAVGFASASSFSGPKGVAVSASGSVYILDTNNHNVKVLLCPSASPTPSISVGASASASATPSASARPSPTMTPTATASGRGCSLTQFVGGWGNSATLALSGAPLAVSINTPSGLVVAADGRLFWTDTGNSAVANSHDIRMLDATGTFVSSLAGGSTAGAFVNSLGPAARFSAPFALALSGEGDIIFVADTANNRVRWVSVSTGNANLLAGSGAASSVDAIGAAATFNGPKGIACDPNSGVIYVSDTNAHRIRLVTFPVGAVSTIAGNGVVGFLDGVGVAAFFSSPMGLTIDTSSGTVYIADYANHAVRVLTPSGSVSTLAGNGAGFYLEGVGASASFNGPTGLSLDASTGLLYVADSLNFRIRVVTTALTGGVVGQTSTLVGIGASGQLDGPTSIATLKNPLSVAVLPGGAVVVAEGTGAVLRRVDCGSPSATPTVTPSASSGASASASPTATSSGTPSSTPTPSPTGTSNGCVVSTYAGSGVAAWADGDRLASALKAPGALALAIDAGGAGTALFVADYTNALVRVVSPALGRVGTLGGAAGVTGCVDGAGASARFTTPEAIAVGASGVYVVGGCNKVRFLRLPSTAAALTTAFSPSVTTIAGSGALSSIDGVGALAAFNMPSGIALAGFYGSLLFVSDRGSHLIRAVNISSGVVVTAAGGACGPTTGGWLDGVALMSCFNTPRGLAYSETSGTLYIADTAGLRVRSLSNGVVSTVAGSGMTGAFDGTATSTTFSNPYHVTLDPTGISTLFVADGNLVRAVRLADRTTTTLAFTNAFGVGYVNGPAVLARSSALRGLAVLPSGLLLCSDSGNNVLRAVDCSFGMTQTATNSPTVTCSSIPTPPMTPTPSSTSTNSQSVSSTSTLSSSVTPASTGTGSTTTTVSSSSTSSPSSTLSSSATPSVTSTGSDSATPTPSESPTPSGSDSVSTTTSVSPTASGTLTPTSSLGGSASSTPSPTQSVSTTSTPPLSMTPSPTTTGPMTPTTSVTLSPSDSAMTTQTQSGSPSGTTSGTGSPSRTVSTTPTLSSSMSSTPTTSVTQGASLSNTPSGSDTPSQTASTTPSATLTGTGTSSGTPTSSETPSSTLSLSRSISRTPTASVTRGASPSSTGSDTGTSSTTSTASLSVTPTSTSTGSGTGTSSFSPSQTPSGSDSSSSTLSLSTTASATPTTTLSSGGSASGTPSVSLSATTTPTPTSSSTATALATPTSTPSGTSTASTTGTPSSTPTTTVTLSSSVSNTATPSVTLGASASTTPSNSGTPSTTPTQSESGTPTGSPTATPTPTSSETPSSTASLSHSMSRTPTASVTNGASSSNTGSDSGSASSTNTASVSQTPTASGTTSSTGTSTTTGSGTPTGSDTGSSTISASSTVSATPTPSLSPGASGSITPSSSSTPISVTSTATLTATPTGTGSVTQTATPSGTGTPTSTISRGASPSVTASASNTPASTPSLNTTLSATASLSSLSTRPPTMTTTTNPTFPTRSSTQSAAHNSASPTAAPIIPSTSSTPAPSADAFFATAVINQNVSAAFRTSMTVTRADAGSFADEVVAGALANAWAMSAAAAAGAIPGSLALSFNAASASSALSYVATGTTSSGSAVKIVIVPTYATDGLSVTLSLMGTYVQSVTSTVAIPASAYGNAAAVAAAALAAARTAGSATAAAVAAVAESVSSAASAAAAAIQGTIPSSALSILLTNATSAALERESATSRAAAVRAAGLALTAGSATSDTAVVSNPSVGAMSAPAAGGVSAAAGGLSIGTVGAAVGGLILLALVAFIFFRRRRAQFAAAASSNRKTGKANPLPTRTSLSPRRKSGADEDAFIALNPLRADKIAKNNSPTSKSRSRSKSGSAPTSPLVLTSRTPERAPEAAEEPTAVVSQKKKKRSSAAAAMGSVGGSEQLRADSYAPPMTENPLLASPSKGGSRTKKTLGSAPSPLMLPSSTPVEAQLDINDELPPGWKRAKSRSGTPYYVHSSGEKSKHRPLK